jgi:hypothetical protein
MISPRGASSDAVRVEREQWLDILRHNRGFAEPERWVSYARSQGFRKVTSTTVRGCPDCGGRLSNSLGQYVYYSTLIQLRQCCDCDLGYADTHIDPEVVRSHFERAYKDEDYFRKGRTAIYRSIVELADRIAPPHGRVIDVGGARGHLLAELRRRRGDLRLTLSDISRRACDDAEATHGFSTICSSIPGLAQTSARFDLILLIDVLYYEPDIRGAWAALNEIADVSSTLLLRLPDRLRLLSLSRRLQVLLRGAGRLGRQVTIPFFNPEHVYVFSREYLRSRLESIGFGSVQFLPSRLLVGGGIRRLGEAGYFRGASALARLSPRFSRLTPSCLVIARRGEPVSQRAARSRA